MSDWLDQSVAMSSAILRHEEMVELVPVGCPNPSCDEECNVCFSTGTVLVPSHTIDFRQEGFIRVTA